MESDNRMNICIFLRVFIYLLFLFFIFLLLSRSLFLLLPLFLMGRREGKRGWGGESGGRRFLISKAIENTEVFIYILNIYLKKKMFVWYFFFYFPVFFPAVAFSVSAIDVNKTSFWNLLFFTLTFDFIFFSFFSFLKTFEKKKKVGEIKRKKNLNGRSRRRSGKRKAGSRELVRKKEKW